MGLSKLEKFLLENNFHSEDPKTLFERVLSFFQASNPNEEELRAYAELELSKLERGLFLLDIVISTAPLLGLLGTVSGLMHVFSNSISSDSTMSNEVLANGIALALTTTALGLIIAIPAIIANNIIMRKIDKVRAKISLLIEHLK